jgi:hypothetical protein
MMFLYQQAIFTFDRQPDVPPFTAPSTAVSFNVGGIVAHQPTFSKKKYHETLAELDRDREARYAGLSQIERLDAQIREIDTQLAGVPDSIRDSYASATQRRAELILERAVEERQQKVRAMADEIKAKRRASLKANG